MLRYKMIFDLQKLDQENAMKKLTLLGTVLCAGLLTAAPFSLQWSPAKTLSVSLDTAGAVIGRPLTPGSVAGVSRRVYRRAIDMDTTATMARQEPPPRELTIIADRPAVTILIHLAIECPLPARW